MTVVCACRLNVSASGKNDTTGEPVTVGLPWPRGAITEPNNFHLVGPANVALPLQAEVLDRWPDGSIRWCLFDFTLESGVSDGYTIQATDSARATDIVMSVEPLPELVLRFTHQPSDSHTIALGVQPLGGTVGPVRTRSLLSPHTIGGLQISGFVDRFVNAPIVRWQLTVTNPNAADHPGGNWDLGNGGSLLFHELSVSVPIAVRTASESTVLLSPEPGIPAVVGASTVLFQASSGGKNWDSTNHINRHRRVDLEFSGYQTLKDGRMTAGARATPFVVHQRDNRAIGVTMAHFWQNFPKSIGADVNGVSLGLFPKQAREHELQGGEQKTHVFTTLGGTNLDAERWCEIGRLPSRVFAAPEWYAQCEVLNYLTPRETDPNSRYLSMVDLALEGEDSFEQKREQIDEYGWRHFGDIYGDHEAVKHTGPKPMISHYNNQYDCVLAFFIQFFRSADRRWLEQGLACADHTTDIDIYHTRADRAAYNGGLFWHTYHYAEADTANHRSYPRILTTGPVESLTEKMDELGETAAKLKQAYAVGGGPASSHNYNAGLMTAYFLTGDPRYRETAIDLANFVMRIEDPLATPFKVLSRTPTGLATESGGGGYHGPGRAAGNSILALLVGYRLSSEVRYLAFAESLIRRVVHPNQNLAQLDLLNAELRWFYTMTLQALGAYLDVKAEREQLDEQYAYARLTLLHYARWMAANERPILATPEKLQYPTETWAAQDMRKVEVFQFAAKYAETDAERTQFLERAEWFFEDVQTRLGAFPTKTLCRPIILMMKYGWTRNWWRTNSTATAPKPQNSYQSSDFGSWRMFVPQKTIAIRRAKRIAIAGVVVGIMLVALAGYWLLRS